jgi:hypothetical protein
VDRAFYRRIGGRRFLECRGNPYAVFVAGDSAQFLLIPAEFRLFALWGGRFMSPDEYRRHAAECLRISESVIDSQHRTALLDMAQSWLLLAHQAERNLTTDLVYEAPPRRERPVLQQQQQQTQPKKE